MHLEVHGKGPPLVLIHGWAMHSGIFAPLIARLSDRFSLHLVDLPGHGLSDERDGELSLHDCARRIAHAVPEAIWIGWSLGGLIALTAALEQSWHVRGVVPIAASPRFVLGDNWQHGVAHQMFAEFGEGLRQDYLATIQRFLALEVHGSENAKAELRELRAHIFERGEPALPMLEQGLAILDQCDLRTELGHLACPSLWIAGSRDRLVPWQAMQWAAERAPGGQFLKISGGGHAPFIAQAGLVADAIAEFARVELS